MKNKGRVLNSVVYTPIALFCSISPFFHFHDVIGACVAWRDENQVSYVAWS